MTRKKTFIEHFWWVFLLLIIFITPVVRTWWWFLAPFVLVVPFTKLYLWWIRWDKWYLEQEWVLLEIKPPQEIETPFKAMEDAFNVFWTIYDAPNWREKWCEGELPKAPFWSSFEIASIEGEIHFYIRCLKPHQHIIESTIYSHYPAAEISEVPDYTDLVPQTIPNEEWAVYGSDICPGKEDFYPIRTYSSFFEESPQTPEEKRIDPIGSLIEDMARLGKGEHFWLQIIAAPITDNDIDWITPAKEEVNKIANRPKAKKMKSFIEQFWEEFGKLFHGSLEHIEETGSLSPGVSESGMKEMLMTPGEREICSAIEHKITKPAFKANVRGMYVARRDIFDSGHAKMGQTYFRHFSTQNLNFFVFLLDTRPKIHYILRGRRAYSRARRMLRYYVKRFPPFYPEMNTRGTFILNTEELASIYHFPAKINAIVAPSVSKVEAKKGGPPRGLPTEE